MANPYADINPRDVDPAKGPFEPTNRMPHGVMHIDKTYQDQLPKEKRPRYQRWLKTQ
jgi:hypothetical protein